MLSEDRTRERCSVRTEPERDTKGGENQREMLRVERTREGGRERETERETDRETEREMLSEERTTEREGERGGRERKTETERC